MEIRVKINFLITIFSPFLFSIMVLSNTPNLHISQLQNTRIFNTSIQYSRAHFLIEVNEKSSRTNGLMMIVDSGLLFRATLCDIP